MASDTGALFSTVAPKDYLGLSEGGEPRYDRVAQFLRLNGKEVASATGVTSGSIHLTSNRVPPEVAERLVQWAQALNLVAHYFGGDAEKTHLWFTIPNPLLGGITPRDMIRMGRFHRLNLFIRTALAENEAAPEAP